MNGDVRNRLRMWLRSEQALGLSSVHAPPTDSQAFVPAEANSPEAADEDVAQAPAAASSAVAQPSVDLFGTSPLPSSGSGLIAPSADHPVFDAPVLSPDEKRGRLVAMDDKEVRGCTKCRLCETRTKTVFGEGDPSARIFFIGEGPGQTEDETGRPFVGRAGELLDKWIAAMGLARGQVFIANLVKCRPPGNREPAPDEVATCTPYLQRQIEIVRPEVLITLGRPATQYMLQSKLSMSRLRGQWQSWRGIKLMPTYHPAYILRSYTYDNRSAVWSDLKKVMAELKLPLPKK